MRICRLRPGMLACAKLASEHRAVQRFCADGFKPQKINTKAGFEAVEFHQHDRADPLWGIAGAGQTNLDAVHGAIAAKGFKPDLAGALRFGLQVLAQPRQKPV